MPAKVQFSSSMAMRHLARCYCSTSCRVHRCAKVHRQTRWERSRSCMRLCDGQRRCRRAYPTLTDWVRAFDRLRARYQGAAGPLPQDLCDQAQSLWRELLASQSPQLLHGDLHHDNIVAAAGGTFLAIDPKGVVGDPIYDTSAFLRNHVEGRPNPLALLEEAIDIICSRLTLDRRRVMSFGLADSMLSAIWTLDDHGHGYENAVICAKRFQQLLDSDSP